MARSAKTPDPEPRSRGRLFWICLLVFLEIVVFTVVAVVGAPDVVAAIVALVVGAVFVAVFNERIWGEGWRERARAERAKAQSAHRPR